MKIAGRASVSPVYVSVTFENVKLTYTGDTEARPAIFIDDSTDVKTEGCSFRPPAGSYPAVYATGRKSPLPLPR